MKNTFLKSVFKIAVPVTLQSLLQSSFGVVDQIMIGQLGSVSVAGVGLAGKFTSIYSVLASAVGAVAGIMISQYVGQKNKKEVFRSLRVNLLLALAVALAFTLLSLLLPMSIMGLYTSDGATCAAAALYLRITALTFIPQAGSVMFAALFRCIDRASLPLYSTIAAAVLNTGLNYVLIFGKLGFAPMGVQGAAVATLVSQWLSFLVMLVMYLKYRKKEKPAPGEICGKFNFRQYALMLLPILACELAWSLGENVYAVIYGHLGTDACAAMTLTNPIQSLMTGALCGLSQAAGVIIGKMLGSGEFDSAYSSSKKLMLYGLAASLALSAILLIIRPFYVQIYNVEPQVKNLTQQILIAYALIAPVKIQNMTLGGGILRSGGKTKYVMAIDIIGTWAFGVPLGLLTAFVFNLSIPWVYLFLSLEECVRLAISLCLFRRKKWMKQIS